MDAEYVSEYGPRDRSARETRKDKGLSYQRRLRNRRAKKAQRELDDLEDNFDEERAAREEHNKEHEAATQAGLPPGALSWREKRELPATAAADADAYVVVRNSILCKWLKNPHEYLTRAEAIKGLRAKHAPTAKLAHDFLTRYGYINTGVFDNPRKEWNKEKVIILGAGASGLAAAKHLHHLGYRVTVLEARDRVGGRVCTNNSLGGEIDMGAMVVTGTIGNPVFNLIKQVREEVHILESDCPLYTAAGVPPPTDLDEKVEKDFNDVLRLTNKVQYWDLMREEKNTPTVFGKAAYVKEEKKLVMPTPEEEEARKAEKPSEDAPPVKEEEKGEQHSAAATQTVKEEEDDSMQVPSMEEDEPSNAIAAQQQPHNDAAVKTEVEPADHVGAVPVMTEAAQVKSETEALPAFYTELMGEDAGQPESTEMATVKDEGAAEKGSATNGTKGSPPPRKRVVSLTAALSLSSSSEKITDRTSLGRAIDHVLQEQKLYPEYTPLERSTFDWHVANLEYACAAELADISLRHWDQDDQYDFEGHHCLLQKGYGSVLQKLADGLDVRYNHPVQALHYNDDSVKVTTADGETFEGDIVLVTLPLGVLKQGAVDFEPPLPGWKVDVINRMGFGNLNKIGLQFPSVFWDDTKDYFGVCDDEIEQRGECFIYNNMHRCMNKPILLALVAGGAAYTHEERSDEEIVARAMRKLRQVYPECPDPINHVITRWYSDPFARGSYSYVSVDASGDDYDMLARPVSLRLFFAGEATQREHPATVAGAYLSGLREAGRIDRAWSGPLETEEIVARATSKRKSIATESKSRKSATQSLSAMPRFKKKASSGSGNGHNDRDRNGDRHERDDGDRDRYRDRDGDRDRNDDRRDRDRDHDRDRDYHRDRDGDRDRDRDRDNDRDRDRDRDRRSDGWDRRDGEKRKTPPRSSPPQQQKKYRWEDAFPSSSSSLPSPSSAMTSSTTAAQLPFQSNTPFATQALRPPVLSSMPRVMGVPYSNGGQPQHYHQQQQPQPQQPMPTAASAIYNPAFPTHLPNRPAIHMAPPAQQQLYQQQQQMPIGLNQFGTMGGNQPFIPTPQQAMQNLAMAGLVAANTPPLAAAAAALRDSSGVGEVPQGRSREEKEARRREKGKIPVANTASGKDKSGAPVSSEKKFRKTVGSYVVKYLKKYLDQGKVKSKDDFKHLARKLTHLIVEKEQRRLLVKKASSKKGRSAELKWNEKVKTKLISFVDEYMDKLPGAYEAKSLKL